ncbi:MAG: hypothetical protein K8R92_07000 [Planctomycetes bacterium]|nr:hypothetical protein [Planctomycetota bacterium]
MSKTFSPFILLVQLPVLLLFFQYQINWLYEDSVVRTASNVVILSLAGMFLLKNCDLPFMGFFVVVLFLVAATVLGSPSKALAAALMFAYGYGCVARADRFLNRSLRMLLLLNAVLILLQVLGVDSLLYRFQFYSPDWTSYNSFLDGETRLVPVHQSRPPGIFPSTIYLSIFECLVFGQLATSRSYGGKTVKFLTGVAFALTGSTTSSMLFVLSLFFPSRKGPFRYFQGGFLLGLLFVYLFLYPIFLENYSLDIKLSRFGDRLFDEGGHSTLTDNFGTFAIVSLFLVVLLFGLGRYLKMRGKFSLFGTLIFLIVGITPLLIHAILEDVRYWFIVGTACGQFIAGLTSMFGVIRFEHRCASA